MKFDFMAFRCFHTSSLFYQAGEARTVFFFLFFSVFYIFQSFWAQRDVTYAPRPGDYSAGETAGISNIKNCEEMCCNTLKLSVNIN